MTDYRNILKQAQAGELKNVTLAELNAPVSPSVDVPKLKRAKLVYPNFRHRYPKWVD